MRAVIVGDPVRQSVDEVSQTSSVCPTTTTPLLLNNAHKLRALVADVICKGLRDPLLMAGCLLLGCSINQQSGDSHARLSISAKGITKRASLCFTQTLTNQPTSRIQTTTTD